MNVRKQYGADITYGTNNEFGFDYLRDNMKFDRESLVQRELSYAVVDEVDSILIDEARTPLIMSGLLKNPQTCITRLTRLSRVLSRETDFTVDEKARTVVLTEEGVASAENILKIENLYDPKHIELLHHINQAVKAHTLFKLDVDYIVKNGEGDYCGRVYGSRLMPGRRYSEGLHQALEAKRR